MPYSFVVRTRLDSLLRCIRTTENSGVDKTMDTFVRTTRCSPLFFKSLDEFVRVALNVLFATAVVGDYTKKKPLYLTTQHLDRFIEAFKDTYMQADNEPLYLQNDGKTVLGIRLVRIQECLRDEHPEVRLSKCKPDRYAHLHSIEKVLVWITQLCIVTCVRSCRELNMRKTIVKRRRTDQEREEHEKEQKDDELKTTQAAPAPAGTEEKNEEVNKDQEQVEEKTQADICRREGDGQPDDDDDDDDDDSSSSGDEMDRTQRKKKKKKKMKYKQYQSVYLTDAIVHSTSCLIFPDYVEPTPPPVVERCPTVIPVEQKETIE